VHEGNSQPPACLMRASGWAAHEGNSQQSVLDARELA
jgi:hypothetical protein